MKSEKRERIYYVITIGGLIFLLLVLAIRAIAPRLSPNAGPDIEQHKYVARLRIQEILENSTVWGGHKDVNIDAVVFQYVLDSSGRLKSEESIGAKRTFSSVGQVNYSFINASGRKIERQREFGYFAVWETNFGDWHLKDSVKIMFMDPDKAE